MSRRSFFIINFYSVARLLCQMVNTPTVLYSTVLYTLVSSTLRVWQWEGCFVSREAVEDNIHYCTLHYCMYSVQVDVLEPVERLKREVGSTVLYSTALYCTLSQYCTGCANHQCPRYIIVCSWWECTVLYCAVYCTVGGCCVG